MPFKRSVMRFAHSSGHTDCCYTDNGERIITSGSDGDIRIWNGIDDDDPSSQCVGEFVLAICHYNERMLASTDLNTVQAYTFPAGDRDGIEFRFTAPATCIKVDKKFIAAGSEDTLIKVTPLDKSEEFFELTGHAGPILSIDTSVTELLASSSGDGSIIIWNLTEKKKIKTILGFKKIKSFQAATTFVSPSFEPNRGTEMAYIKDTEIIIVDTKSWDTKTTLKDSKTTGEYSVCAYSHCGKYLAAGTVTGEISIWNVRSGEIVRGETKGTDPNGITAIAWNPSGNGEFVYADNSGQLGTVNDCWIADDGENDIFKEGASDTTSEVNFGGIDFVDDAAVDDDGEEDNENCVSLNRLKDSIMKTNEDNEIDDLLEAKTARSNSVMGDPIGPMIKMTPLQPPFQPSATPKHLEHRFMVWNDVGIVRSHATDAENSVEVEFHDSRVHHGFHLKNYLHHTMASLSTTALALSCETPSRLVVITFGDGSREWSTALPNCEEVISVAASENLVAIATDARYLRLFSVKGTQREMISLNGPAIATAAHGNTILVAYHSGGTGSTENCQCISMMLVQVIGLGLRCRDVKLPLTPGTKLNWIGFTDFGSPVTCDSFGMVRLFNAKSNYWLPICDTSLHIKNISDTYFVLDVSEQRQIVRAILCRGSAFPVTSPRPFVQELPMQVPLCDLEAAKSQLEESLIRSANMNVENVDRQLKEIAIKLFALACRSEMESRAKELVEMIASPILLEMAVKYAFKLGRIHLSEKLTELLPKIEEKESERNKQMSGMEMEVVNFLQKTPMNATLLLNQKDGGDGSNHSPVITPKPLSVSQLKRNPFKRTPAGLAKTVKNPLSHLTDKAIGYNDSQQDSEVQSVCDSESDGIHVLSHSPTPTEENNANKANTPSSTNKVTTTTVTTTTPMSFMVWFNEHKPELQQEYPEAIAAELTKIAMKKYKSLNNQKDTMGTTTSAEATGNNSVHKRKLTDEDNKKPSGISKLAKFGFTK